MEQIEARGIDLSYMPVDNIKVNNESVRVNELQKNLFNTDFINDVVDGKTTVTIDNPDKQRIMICGSMSFNNDLKERFNKLGFSEGNKKTQGTFVQEKAFVS